MHRDRAQTSQTHIYSKQHPLYALNPSMSAPSSLFPTA